MVVFQIIQVELILYKYKSLVLLVNLTNVICIQLGNIKLTQNILISQIEITS